MYAPAQKRKLHILVPKLAFWGDFMIVRYHFSARKLKSMLKPSKSAVWIPKTTCFFSQKCLKKGCVFAELFRLFKGPGRAHALFKGPGRAHALFKGPGRAHIDSYFRFLIQLFFGGFGFKSVFFELLHAKPCRIIQKLPQKVSFESETSEIWPKLWLRLCPDLLLTP